MNNEANVSSTVSPSLRAGIHENVPKHVLQRYASLKDIAESTSFGDLDDCVVLDTECTGVSFKHDDLTQIAAARVRHGEIVDWYITFVNPGKPIPEEIVRLTDIHDEDVADAPDPEEATARLVDFVGDDDVIAHNANFDKTFCTKAKSGAPLLQNVWIDSLDVARIALPRMKSHRLIDLTKAFDVVASTHRADDDVRSLADVYRIMLAAVSQMPDDLVMYIAGLADVDEWPSGKVFKHFANEIAKQTGETPDLPEQPARNVLNLHLLRDANIDAQMLSKRHDAERLSQDPTVGLHFASDEEIADEFTEDGLAGRMYENYEPRSEQVRMATAVNDAFSKSENLAVEAGTGVGKSLAYLVPAIKTARQNDITVGVATKTNALLDQLANHELPAINQAGVDVDYAILKGTQHYLCLLELDRLVKRGAEIKVEDNRTVSTAAALAGLVSFVEQNDYEDIDSLNWDRRAIPRYEVTIKGENCLRHRCPFFGKECYVYGARQRAESADILVTNQTLLFCDLKTDGGILPPIRYWVVDEAHGAEEEARRAFSKKVDINELQRLAHNLNGLGKRDVFSQAEKKLIKSHPASEAEPAMEDGLDSTAASTEPPIDDTSSTIPTSGDTLVRANINKARIESAAFDEKLQIFAREIRNLHIFGENGSRNYSQQDVWISEEMRSHSEFQKFEKSAKDMCEVVERLIKPLSNLVSLLDQEKGVANLQSELAICVSTLKELLDSCDIIFFHPTHAYAYSAHLNKSDHAREYIEAQMLNVGQELDETLYSRTHSVVFASATLSTNQDFQAFNNAMGLNQDENSSSTSVLIPSSYDFDHHMTVYVITDAPAPGESRYIRDLSRFLSRLHIAQNGSTLTLFTNRREMERCFDAVEPVVDDKGLHVVCQKYGLSIKGLRDQFIQDEHLSLFALKSFWEGFDAPGATLKSVVIPKLPFTSPTDPLYRELNALTGNAWRTFTLPKSIIEIKQAAGRLIRSSTDTGNLVLYDRRITDRHYGSQFIASLPSKNIQRVTAGEAIRRIAAQNDSVE